MFDVLITWILQLNLIVIGLAFVFQLLDAALGMGFGTLTPLLLILGFLPLEVVPSVILTTAILGIISGLIHMLFKNLNFWYGIKNVKLVAIFLIPGILAIFAGMFVAISIPDFVLKIYIGCLTIMAGLLLFVNNIVRKKRSAYFNELKEYFETYSNIVVKIKKEEGDPHKISWSRLGSLAALASFNKGMTGGGYGTIISTGQVLSGIDSRRAVVITVIVEGLVSTVGFIAYYFISQNITINWFLTFSMLIGGFIAAPVSGLIVNKINPNKLAYGIGIFSSLIGLFSILSTILGFTLHV